jgi:signal transduction histidine kinase
LRVGIADDGHGFDPSSVHESGLRGLRDRVEALGGHLHIESPDSGTRLDASFPTSNGSHG